MKQSDVFSIILVASIGTIAAFFACNAILGDPDLQRVTFKTIDPISAELKNPNPETFNDQAINPTVEVYVSGCEDVDQNGILDRNELINCGKAVPDPVEEKAENENKIDGQSDESSIERSGSNSTSQAGKESDTSSSEEGR